jgi:phosphotriesterase-related protein
MVYSRDALKGKILTVQGLMEPDELGVVLPHEHCLLDGSAVYQAPPKEANLLHFFYQPVSIDTIARIRYGGINLDNSFLLDEDTACEELLRYVKQGGSSLADATIKGLGQDPDALLRISHRTGINIIMGCG